MLSQMIVILNINDDYLQGGRDMEGLPCLLTLSGWRKRRRRHTTLALRSGDLGHLWSRPGPRDQDILREVFLKENHGSLCCPVGGLAA